MRRSFRPDYVSFAGTYQCNLACPHCCVPIEWTDRLPIDTAIHFLEDAHIQGIRRIGFTGGEPFVYPEFVIAVARRAAELGFRFDKVMSNGVWYQDEAHLTQVLSDLQTAGFTGKLGMTVDKFHGIDIDKLALFCLTARKVFARDNILSLSYASRAPDQGLELIKRLAETLGGVLEYSELLHRHIVVTDDLTMTLNWNHLAPVERAEKFAGGWDGEWFKEDYCEGPGQALIVTPKGEVKPCCGFASDLDQLTIGNIHTDSVEQIIKQARSHPYVGKVFRDGLTAVVDEILERDPDALPGKSSNQCYVCWYVLTRGLVETMPGGGGQIGQWTGARANYAGELIELGLIRRRK
ncbi:MAG TPA: radical SAM protein [Gemmatales bacterium]|nr:radical SAM protein [Gemmatales bacterium]